jgi:hypothetical protein
MPWSGGSFSRVHDWTTDAAVPIDIEADRMDAEDDNFRDGINDCIHKGGQNTATSNLPMGGNRHTAVGNAAARDDYASAADIQDQDLVYAVDAGAADAYVITLSPAVTAYEDGQRFVWRSVNNNTGASTLNVNAVGAKSIRTADGIALEAGAILSGGYYETVYDGNNDRFIITSTPSEIPDTMLSANVPLLDAANVFSAINEIEGADARQRLDQTDAAADERIWEWSATGGQLLLKTLTDAYAAGNSIMVVDRTGTTVDTVNFPTGLQSAGGDVFNNGAAAIQGNALDPANDGFPVDDNGVVKMMSFQDAGFVVQTEAGATKTIAGADLNQIIEFTAAGGCVVTLNTGVGVKGNWMVFVQAGGSTAVTTVGTATVNGANGIDTTGTQYSGITLFCTAANTWVVLGDAA